jgi:ectoine hydroxylase-related dioxygenase (phytanoyl-CoA dioxygenase family)
MVCAQRSDIIVLNAHTWHAGCPNRSLRTDKPAIHAFFSRRDKPQQQHQQRLIPAAVRARLNPVVRWVCALDDAENERVMAEARAAGTPTSGLLPPARPAGSRL